MGNYANNLEARLRARRQPAPAPDPSVERLKCVAIERGGKVHDGLRSHYELRASIGDENPVAATPGDIEGFMTSAGRFVTRAEAQDVALAAGQIRSLQGRPLLSSDINW